MSESSGVNLNNIKRPPDKSSGRKILLLLAMIFVLPFTVAKTMHLLNVHPASHSYGTLVNPPLALQFPMLHDAQGKEFKAQQWLKKWTIVMVDDLGCAEPCEAQVHLLKQVHTSLDKDAHRVQRILLVPTESKNDTYIGLQKQYPDLVILAGADAETVKFASEFNVAKGRVYLVDPFGNLMMSYPADMNPKGMQTDLKKLLKNSWAG
jgi:cytochrome oxidase Cu insertion factor (SCO1/SenC/PrrC family)